MASGLEWGGGAYKIPQSIQYPKFGAGYPVSTNEGGANPGGGFNPPKLPERYGNSSGSGGGGAGGGGGAHGGQLPGYEHESALLSQKAYIQTEAENRRLADMTRLWSSNQGGIHGAMPTLPTYQAPGGGGSVGRVGQVTMPDLAQAQAAAFARQKDKTGQAAQGAMTGLRSALGGRGMLGSGAESRGVSNIAMAGLGELGNISREQAIQDAAARTQGVLTSYQGNITQRGQDMNQMNVGADQSFRAAQATYEAAMDQWRAKQAAQEKNFQGLFSGGTNTSPGYY